MDRSRLFQRLLCLYAATALVLPAYAQDQPQGSKAPPSATAPAATKDQQPPAPHPPPRKPTPKEEADGLLGKEVYGADGAQMGLVTNVLIDREGQPIALVIDFGGFLGVGSRKVAIDWHLMQFHPGSKDRPVTLSLSKDQLKSAPEYKSEKAAIIVRGPMPPPAATTAKQPGEAAKPPSKPPEPTAPKPTEPPSTDNNGQK